MMLKTCVRNEIWGLFKEGSLIMASKSNVMTSIDTELRDDEALKAVIAKKYESLSNFLNEKLKELKKSIKR